VSAPWWAGSAVRCGRSSSVTERCCRAMSRPGAWRLAACQRGASAPPVHSRLAGTAGRTTCAQLALTPLTRPPATSCPRPLQVWALCRLGAQHSFHLRAGQPQEPDASPAQDLWEAGGRRGRFRGHGGRRWQRCRGGCRREAAAYATVGGGRGPAVKGPAAAAHGCRSGLSRGGRRPLRCAWLGGWLLLLFPRDLET
jgi:hypothetical protein